MKHLDLFSGIGGFTLACQWVGIETIGFVEIDKYCQKVLKKHWPDVPIVEDIRNVERIKEIVANATELRDSKLCDNGNCESYQESKGQSGGDSLRVGILPRAINQSESPAILITAGFPCQPFSVAGKRGSKEDDRYLWPETLAVIKAVKPAWVLLENVTGIIPLALDTVLSDLEGADYSYETLIIPACAVNAPHRRDRVWVVAYSQCSRCNTGEHRLPRGTNTTGGENDTQSFQDRARQRFGVSEAIESCGEAVALSKGTGRGAWASKGQSGRCSEIMAHSKTGKSREQAEPEGGQDSGRGSEEVAVSDTQREGLEGEQQRPREGMGSRLELCREQQSDWWAAEPELGRVAHGIPHRVDRLKCLGNAIVPQVASEIIKIIVEIENEL